MALATAAEGARFAGSARAQAKADTLRERFFKGFKTELIMTSGATIKTVYGGNRNRSPLLLLHGIPETHVLWRKVAPVLARDYFVVMTDLRGYGDSSKPAGGGDHFAYSKRAMAQDQVGMTGADGRRTAWLSIIPKRSRNSSFWTSCRPICSISTSRRSSPRFFITGF